MSNAQRVTQVGKKAGRLNSTNRRGCATSATPSFSNDYSPSVGNIAKVLQMNNLDILILCAEVFYKIFCNFLPAIALVAMFGIICKAFKLI